MTDVDEFTRELALIQRDLERDKRRMLLIAIPLALALVTMGYAVGAYVEGGGAAYQTLACP
jgi:hypothetical protein